MFAALLAAAIFHESLTPTTVLGGALVLLAVYLALSTVTSNAPAAT
ncbi:MAG: hypothetical protein ACREM6_15235 [Vulcanimicrobiaceae bacterium]